MRFRDRSKPAPADVAAAGACAVVHDERIGRKLTLALDTSQKMRLERLAVAGIERSQCVRFNVTFLYRVTVHSVPPCLR